MRPPVLLALSSSLLSLIGCGGGDTTPPTTTTSSSSSSSSSSGAGGSGGAATTTTSTGSGGSAGCERVPGPADGPRKLVVSHPYDASAAKANVWEVLDVDAAGAITVTGNTVEMGRAFYGEVVFTPDGKVGITVQEDGSLGVLRFDDSGEPTVVHAAFKGSFYAGSVVIDPTGDGAFILDPNWRNNGGGLYRVSIGCDGALTDLGLVAPSKLAYGMVRLGATPARAVLASADVLGSPATDSAHLLDLGGGEPTLLGGAPAFPDDEAIVAAVARTADDKFVLLGDNSEFSSVPNRISVLAVSSNGLSPVQMIPDLNDPFAILPSPFGNAAMMVSGYGNAFFAMGYDPGSAATPFTMKGEVAYLGKKPQLPGNGVVIGRGALKGRAFVAETSGVRRVRFEADGQITDLGVLDFGEGLEKMVGAIGVTP